MNYFIEIASLIEQCHQLVLHTSRMRDPEAHRRLDALRRRQDELRKRAIEEFAALNGWRCARRGAFLVSVLIRGGVHNGPRDYEKMNFFDSFHHHELFDHAVRFRESAHPYRAVAIVGQPYNTSAEQARVAAEKLGLELHVPPVIDASWWYPTATRFFCFTRPGTVVRFLPQQIIHEAVTCP